ncbi:MAG: hypothetical protein ACRDWA_16370 [Acidimicrobiia bacterium]
MKTHSLYRAAAVTLVLSAVLTLSGFLAHPPVDPGEMTSAVWQVSHLVLWIGGAAGVMGLAGLYLRHRMEAGLLGTIGAALATLGLLALTGAYYYEAVIVPTLAMEAPTRVTSFPGGDAWATYRMTIAASSIAAGLGIVLLGMALLRTRLPSWAIVAAAIGGLGTGIQFIPPRPVSLGAVALLALGLVGLGSGLWNSAPTPQPG